MDMRRVVIVGGVGLTLLQWHFSLSAGEKPNAQRKYTPGGLILHMSEHKQGRLLVSLTAYVLQIFSYVGYYHK